MPSGRDIFRAALMRFLPSAIGTLLGLLVVVEAVHARDGLASLRHVSWFVFIVEAAAMTAGYTALLLAMRMQSRTEVVITGRRSFAAACLAVVLLSVASIFMQGSRMLGIVSISAVVGALSALVTSWRFGSPRHYALGAE